MITSTPVRGTEILESEKKGNDSLHRYFEDVTAKLNTIPLANYAATGNPTINDDAKKGYSVGSDWLNTATNKWYKCRSAVIGAAAWDLLN